MCKRLPKFWAASCFSGSHTAHYALEIFGLTRGSPKVYFPMVQVIKSTTSKRIFAVAVLVGSVLCTTLGFAKAPNSFVGLETIQLIQLPSQGRDTYQRIQQGGPFPFDKDGGVFGNRERILPSQQRGYYREYTVKTAGAGNRGAKRIVCGGPPRAPDACFYTSDHYASFRHIVE